MMSPSPIALAGFTVDEILNIANKQAFGKVHPDGRDISVSQLHRIASGEDDPVFVECRWKIKSGEFRWFNDSRKPMRDEHGHPVALIVIKRDITVRKLAKLELEQA